MQTITNRHFSLPIVLLLFSFILTSCLDSSDSGQSMGDLLEEAEAIDDFDTFVDYLGQPETVQLNSILADEEETYTVFIPTDEAFSELPDGTMESLEEEELIEVLSYHIVEDLVDLNSIEETDDIASMQGDDIYIEIVPNNQGGASAFINDSEYLGSRSASNGVIYVTDQVLFPDSYLDVTGLIAKRYQLNEFEEAIDDANLNSTLEETDSEFTVFAPSDDALDGESPSGTEIQYYIIDEEKLTSDELSSQTYTTMSGDELDVDANGTITINGEAIVTTADIEGTNGVVHIIDAALEAPSE